MLVILSPGTCKEAYCGAKAEIYHFRVPLSSRNTNIVDLAGHNWFEQGR